MTNAHQLLADLTVQIDSLKGESSCIDEDIMQGEAYSAAKRLVGSLTTDTPPFTLPTTWGAHPYSDHWSFYYAPSTGKRGEYDFRVEFSDEVQEVEQNAVIGLLKAAPKLLNALERYFSEMEIDDAGQRDMEGFEAIARAAIAAAKGGAA